GCKSSGSVMGKRLTYAELTGKEQLPETPRRGVGTRRAWTERGKRQANQTIQGPNEEASSRLQTRGRRPKGLGAPRAASPVRTLRLVNVEERRTVRRPSPLYPQESPPSRVENVPQRFRLFS